MKLESVRQGDRELKVYTRLRQARDAMETLRAEAELKRSVARKRTHKMRTMQRKVAILREDARWFTTSVIHGYPVRMETGVIEPKLALQRFENLTNGVIARAEIAAREKEQLKLRNAVSRNVYTIRRRRAEMKAARAEWTRQERMDLRRSGLGRTMFRRCQLRCLARAFDGWHRIAAQDRAHTQMYKLRFSVLNQNAQLGRWREDMRNDRERRARGEAYYGDQEGPRPGGQTLTRMKAYQRRVVKCVQCRCEYTEDRNHEQACAFHPGKYVLECPESCEHRGKGKARPASCMAHYRWRWTCCDQEEDAPFMTNGCRRRWHRRDEDLELREKRAELLAKETEEDAVNIKWEIRAAVPTDKARVKDLMRLREISDAQVEARKFKERYAALKDQKNTAWAMKKRRMDNEGGGK
jgi:hypothetical protein